MRSLRRAEAVTAVRADRGRVEADPIAVVRRVTSPAAAGSPEVRSIVIGPTLAAIGYLPKDAWDLPQTQLRSERHE
jgi:hypothetical protein